jgi:hypothetical protein
VIAASPGRRRRDTETWLAGLLAYGLAVPFGALTVALSLHLLGDALGRPPAASVAVAALAGALIGLFAFDGGGPGSSGGRTPPAAPIHVRGIGAYDPEGGDGEHDDIAGRATDGSDTTYWNTEHYNDGLQKRGVGVVVDAGRSVAPKRFRVTTDTDGFTAEIRAGSSPTGPFTRVSPSETVNGTTSFPIHGRGRYFVIWITDLGDNQSAHVNEVKAG